MVQRVACPLQEKQCKAPLGYLKSNDSHDSQSTDSGFAEGQFTWKSSPIPPKRQSQDEHFPYSTFGLCPKLRLIQRSALLILKRSLPFPSLHVPLRVHFAPAGMEQPRGTEQGRENNDREIKPIFQVHFLIYLVMYFFLKTKTCTLWTQLPSSWPFFWVVNPLRKQIFKSLTSFLSNYTEPLINSIFNSCLISQQEWFYWLVSNFLYWLLNQVIWDRVFSHVCEATIKEALFHKCNPVIYWVLLFWSSKEYIWMSFISRTLPSTE